MNVAFVVPFYDQRLEDPAEALDRFPILRELPREVAALGHEVRVLMLAPAGGTLQRDGVAYSFVAPARPLRWLGAALDRWKPRHGPAYYQPALGLVLHLRRFQPRLVHSFGLTLDLQLALVARAARSIGARHVVHYHGGLPADSPRLRPIQRHNLRRVDRVLFTSPEQARPWLDAGLLCPEQVGQLMETSSPFRGMPRDEAWRVTGMSGNPVCLSAGRLHPIKDPLTMLEGFELLARELQEARLYLYYLTGELEADLRAYVDARPELAARVAFRGRAALDEMEAIYSSADFLLQASLREWSGLAVLEAMSCGCIPVVTDLPPFTAMTAGGRYGRHFPAGDPAALARAVLDLADGPARARLAAEVQEHFQRELSFTAMARQLDEIYRALA